MILIPQHTADDSYRIEAAMGEVTQEQIKRSDLFDFDQSAKWNAEDGKRSVGNVYYHEAVKYCNWLSRAEGLDKAQLCYPDRGTEPGAPTVFIVDDYRERTGYRLPMAEEWFFMCQAASGSEYSYGDSTSLSKGFSLSRSGSVPSAHSWRIGKARPNAFGIFDGYMNVREWANDIDPADSTRFQVCGSDYRFTWHTTAGISPRYIGWSQPNSTHQYYGFRLFRSRPNERTQGFDDD